MPVQRCGDRRARLNHFSASAKATLLAIFCALLAPLSYSQQYAGPQPVPMPPAIKAPVDEPYPGGSIGLAVSVADRTRRVISVNETIPVQPGELTLLYPAWIPGNHSPTGPISEFAGLKVKANGKSVPWTRDRVNMYAFHHINVPADARTLEVEFDYLSPLKATQAALRCSSNMINLSWNTVVLYPAGYFWRRRYVAPSIQLPEGWHFASALEVASQSGSLVRFKDTTLNTLIDSPLYAASSCARTSRRARATQSSSMFSPTIRRSLGNHAGRAAVASEPGGAGGQTLRLASLQPLRLPVSLRATRWEAKALERINPAKTGRMRTISPIGPRALVAAISSGTSTRIGGTANFGGPETCGLRTWTLPCETTYCRSPRGLTQYWGYVLTARSGMRTPAETRDLIASIAANFEVSPGRDWRPLVDTTNQPIVSQRRPVTWPSWLRGEDCIGRPAGLARCGHEDRRTERRQEIAGRFCADIMESTTAVTSRGPTRFEDIVAALNSVQPYDWAGFLRERVYELHPQGAPEEGVAKGAMT